MTEPWAAQPGPDRDQPLDTPFVPVRGRRVALGVALAAMVVFGGVAFVANAWRPGDRMIVFGIGLLIALLMWRYASIRAVCTRDGLRVRNLIVTREVRYADVEAVRFHDGDPWPYLQLAEGDDLAVMAIQRSDGPRSRREAQRLIDVIELGRA